MALILSFDTATKHLAVVLSEGASPIASRMDASEALSHAEKLNVFIEEVMRGAGRELKDLSAVAVGIGPGSYTGLRIGLSAAKGLCFALDVPLIGMSTLDILVQELIASNFPLQDMDRLHPMIDARRMEVFTRMYDHEGKAMNTTAPLVLDAAWINSLTGEARVIVFGDGADKAADLWRSSTRVHHIAGVRPSVQGLALCANAYFMRGAFADLAYLVPDYGKAANVAQPKKHGA